MPKLRTEHPWTVSILESLADGGWQDYTVVLNAASALVPEEQAFAKAEYYRQYHFTSKGVDATDRIKGDREDTVRTGQRFIASKSILSLRKRGIVEIEYEVAEGRSRRKPVRIRRLDVDSIVD